MAPQFEPVDAPAVTDSAPFAPQPTPAAKPARSMLVDLVRGLAISLVVLGHTNQGIEHRMWWGSSPVGIRLETFIYAFHMPAFFFISGVFLPAGVDKRGKLHFVLDKVSRMLYPYALWMVLATLLTIPLARFERAHTPSLPVFLHGLWTGNAAWFLPTIFFAVLLGALARRLPFFLFFILSIVVALAWHDVGIAFLDRGFAELPFLAAGMWVGRSFAIVERVPTALAAAGGILLGAAVYALTRSPLYFELWMQVPFGILGTLMLFLFARCLGRGRLARLVAWAGEASFGIFLLSAYFQGAGRELTQRLLHTTAPLPQLLLPTLAAILGPAWIYQRRVRLRVDWLFEWPFARQG